MSKLTLSIEPDVAEQAKRYAARRGVSVSRLVSRFLQAVVQSSPGPADEPPVLRRLRGDLRGAQVEDYREHLWRKYR